LKKSYRRLGSTACKQYCLAAGATQGSIAYTQNVSSNLTEPKKITVKTVMIKDIFKTKSPEKKFWDWFEKNNTRFLNLQLKSDDRTEKLIDEILTQLHSYSENIWVQVGGNSEDFTELIITAEGNADYFDRIKTLVNAAPKIAHWKFIALMPPCEPQGISYDNFSISINDLSYSPTLLCGEELDEIAITIKVREYETKSKLEFFDAAIHKLLDLILGEELYSYVAYVDIEEWDSDCKPNIQELNNYILTKRKGQKQN